MEKESKKAYQKDNWNELKYAIKKLFNKEYKFYSKEIKVRFRQEDDEISIFSEDKDFRNRYFDKPPNDGDDFVCWEIFLNKDGTWSVK
jgi:hypothetical protein